MQFIKENLIFTGDESPMANLMLSVLGAVAQFERDLIEENASAKASPSPNNEVHTPGVRTYLPTKLKSYAFA